MNVGTKSRSQRSKPEPEPEESSGGKMSPARKPPVGWETRAGRTMVLGPEPGGKNLQRWLLRASLMGPLGERQPLGWQVASWKVVACMYHSPLG